MANLGTFVILGDLLYKSLRTYLISNKTKKVYQWPVYDTFNDTSLFRAEMHKFHQNEYVNSKHRLTSSA